MNWGGYKNKRSSPGVKRSDHDLKKASTDQFRAIRTGGAIEPPIFLEMREQVAFSTPNMFRVQE